MKNLLLIFMMLFAVDSIAQLDQREKGDVVSPALNKNPNLIQKTGWTFEAIDPINDTLCSVTPSSDNLTILTASDCNARVYQDINSADIRKARFAKETMTVLLKLQSLTYVKITLNVYKKAATTGTLTLLRTRSIENNTGVPLRNKKIVFDVVTEDLNFAPNANLADSLRIEFTFEPTVVFPAGVAEVAVNDFRVFSSPMNYSPLLHEVREESGWTAWQPITITAATTNPTKGTTTTDACRKRRDGTQLKIDFEYRQGTAGTAGSGVYFFSCGGITLNGENLTPDYDLANNVSIGSGDGTSGTFGVVLNTSGQILLSNSAGTISSTNVSMSQSGLIYRFNASIAIKEWKQSTVAVSDRSDSSNPKNWDEFSFNVNMTTTPVVVSDMSSGSPPLSCSRIENGVLECGVNGLNNPLNCTAIRRISGTGSGIAGLAVLDLVDYKSKDKFRLRFDYQAGPINDRMTVTCRKTGQDRIDAFAEYNRALLDMKSMTGIARYIVKTYQSGGSWYEVNNDCWVRQGVNNIDPGTSDSAKTITFQIPMKDTNYFAVKNLLSTHATPLPLIFSSLYNLTTTTAQTFTNSNGRYYSYMIEGYGSKTAIQALHPEIDLSKCQ